MAIFQVFLKELNKVTVICMCVWCMCVERCMHVNMHMECQGQPRSSPNMFGELAVDSFHVYEKAMIIKNESQSTSYQIPRPISDELTIDCEKWNYRSVRAQ